jgi:hypothetical protein
VGTNYYLRHKACEHCQRAQSDLHIGKSSGGWVFGFRAYAAHRDGEGGDVAIRNAKDWAGRIDAVVGAGGWIVDEYDRHVTVEDFWALVKSKQGKHCELYDDDYIDDEGFRFTPREFS